ncbi:MAG: DUF4174 domain-containing protein [Acetobacteraceae bacterium]|nr:DUF4174 domain-containing protein [Acetobacteraceae bacterium]
MPDDPLGRYRWQSRILLLFAPNPDDPAIRQQLDLLRAESAGARERDLLVVLVVADSARTLDGGRIGARDALRARFAAPADRFRVVLVGKDGGAKLSSDQPIAAGRLFRTIDRMPMRRREMGGAQGE